MLLQKFAIFGLTAAITTIKRPSRTRLLVYFCCRHCHIFSLKCSTPQRSDPDNTFSLNLIGWLLTPGGVIYKMPCVVLTEFVSV